MNAMRKFNRTYYTIQTLLLGVVLVSCYNIYHEFTRDKTIPIMIIKPTYWKTTVITEWKDGTLQITLTDTDSTEATR